MSTPVEPTAEERLRTEAGGRDVAVDSPVAEPATTPPAGDPIESFIGCGASGDVRPFDIHRERSEAADRKLATGMLIDRVAR